MLKELPKTNLLLVSIGLAVVLVVFSYPTCANTDEYTSTASLFTIGTGARPLGLGGAFTALADDENALFYNPAGLAFLGEAGLTSFYTNQYSAFHYGSVGYAQKSIGLSYLQLSSGTLKERDLYGNPTGEFSYTSRGLIGAYSKRMGDLALALQGKIYNSASPTSALGYSLSPSFIYRAEPFRVGAIFKNLASTGIRFEDHKEPWKREIVMGIAYLGEIFKVDADFVGGLNERGINPQFARTGAEAWLFPHVGMRIGITSKLQSSIGLSLKFRNFQLDYAYLIHNELPSTHRFSLTARFGKLPKLSIEKFQKYLKEFMGIREKSS